MYHWQMMNKECRITPAPCNDIGGSSSSQQQDYDQMVDPAEVSKILQDQLSTLEAFVQRLGAASLEPIDLRRCAQDISHICQSPVVTGPKIIELANNTIRKMKNNKRLKRNWNKQDLSILLWVIEHHNRLHNTHTDRYTDDDWKSIAQFVPGKNAMQCMFKWLGFKKCNLTEFPWAEAEEQLLRELVAKRGKNQWIEISQELFLANKVTKIYRSPKQCREHWTCYMDPELKKGPWRPQEDLLLLKQYIRLGKRWSEIAKKLNGRTQNAVKNRFNLLMVKQQRSHGRKRSHQYFSNLCIHNLQLLLQRNPKLCSISQDQAQSKLPQSPFQSRKVPFEFINQFTKAENSADTYMTEHESRVTVVGEGDTQETSVRFVKFKRIPLSELLKLTDLFPAVFDKRAMEIKYRQEAQPDQDLAAEVKEENQPN